MKPNAGGIITGKEIIDRDIDIEKIWRSLENQSVILVSERRVGKTSVLRKMLENPSNDWKPVLYFVESKGHPVDFIQGLYTQLLETGMIEDKFFKLREFYKKHIGGEKILNWSFPQMKENWKILLDNLIEDIIDANDKVLLIFDELPLMLYKIIQNQTDAGPVVAMDFLDHFRELRNKYEATKKIAFIFSGSIGLNLIINKLKRENKYIGTPVNNMKTIVLEGMDKEGAILLCDKLSETTPFSFKNKNKVQNIILNVTDRLPYYIQLVFEKFYDLNLHSVSEKDVMAAIDSLLNDPHDNVHFCHYVDRVNTYYENNKVKPAFIVLNYLSQFEKAQPEDQIRNYLNSQFTIDDQEFRELMDLLWEDHYLFREIKDEEKQYKFKYFLLRKWWYINRSNKHE